ncbi:MAG: hypothetical protein ACW98D_20080, partial [Promethearchaeota archaeon]
ILEEISEIPNDKISGDKNEFIRNKIKEIYNKSDEKNVAVLKYGAYRMAKPCGRALENWVGGLNSCNKYYAELYVNLLYI